MMEPSYVNVLAENELLKVQEYVGHYLIIGWGRDLVVPDRKRWDMMMEVLNEADRKIREMER